MTLLHNTLVQIVARAIVTYFVLIDEYILQSTSFFFHSAKNYRSFDINLCVVLDVKFKMCIYLGVIEAFI